MRAVSAVLLVAFIGLALACGTPSGGINSGSKVTDVPLKTGNKPTEIRFGDLGVSVQNVFVDNNGGPSQSAFVVAIRLTNYNTGRVAKASAQTGAAFVLDNLGNKLGTMELKGKFGEPILANGQIARGETIGVRSEEPSFDRVLFEVPVEGAKSVTIALDASKYGGSGVLRYTINRSQWTDSTFWISGR